MLTGAPELSARNQRAPKFKKAKKTTSKNNPPKTIPAQIKMVKIGGTIYPFDGLLV